MDAPQHEFYPEARAEVLVVLFRVTSRKSWDVLQHWHEAFPGSTVEHVLHGTYVLTIPADGARSPAA